MKKILRFESLGLFAVTTYLYFHFGFSVAPFFIFFFLPDIGCLGYIFSPRVGGFLYNALHHQGLISIFLLLGLIINNRVLIEISIIFLSHSNFDRVLGFGLKHLDSFNNTHLEMIGKKKPV